MAFLIGRLWLSSLADYGVAHWQIMAFLIGRLWRGSYWQDMAWLIGGIWRGSVAGAHKIVRTSGLNPVTLVSSTAIFAYYVNIC